MPCASFTSAAPVPERSFHLGSILQPLQSGRPSSSFCEYVIYFHVYILSSIKQLLLSTGVIFFFSVL